jgi:hypothetical protein
VDPITLFALANGAVSAVKAGCKLYKDIKGAAGDIKDVLKDLDNQFSSRHKDASPTIEQRNQYVQERNRVVELNKKANANEHNNIYQEIGDKLGEYYDNMYKCMAIFAEEERRSKNEVFTGDASLGKRALQRVLMRKQLEAMSTELRQIMIYESPPELGALYTEVEEMMKKLGEEQKVLIARQMQAQARQEARRAARMKRLTEEAIIGVIILVMLLAIMFMMMWVAWDRQQKYPKYGDGIFPVNPYRKEEKYIYIGR